jgi:hypothetical protein
VKSDSPLRAACEGGGTFSLDPTPERWDNAYYANVVNEQGVMSSDQILFDSSGTRPETMLNIGVRSGPDGEVRRSCRFVN